MRHILWAVAWMGLGLLITLAAASILQDAAVNQREPSPSPAAGSPPPPPAAPGGRSRPAEPGRHMLLVSRERDKAAE
jgi:hypothetical protein